MTKKEKLRAYEGSTLDKVLLVALVLAFVWLLVLVLDGSV